MPKGRHGNHAKANAAGRWSNDKIRSSHGYIKVRVGVGHPLADPNGYTYEHLLVWVSSGREKPAGNQVIHHINEVKDDNRIENLELIDRVAHGVKHAGTLSDEGVLSLRVRHANGERLCDLSRDLGISVRLVLRYVQGRSRLSAGGPVFPCRTKKGQPCET